MRGKYDVPLPTLADLLTPGINNISREQGAQHFVQLCKLCEILGDASNLAYDLRPLDEKVRQELLELEVNLNQWEANLPPYLTNPLEEGKGPGACNLHFCFLSTKLMLARTSLRVSRTTFEFRPVIDLLPGDFQYQAIRHQYRGLTLSPSSATELGAKNCRFRLRADKSTSRRVLVSM